MLSSIHWLAFSGESFQPALQVDTTSTRLAPLPFMEFSKAFRIAFFVFRMEATEWTD